MRSVKIDDILIEKFQFEDEFTVPAVLEIAAHFMHRPVVFGVKTWETVMKLDM